MNCRAALAVTLSCLLPALPAVAKPSTAQQEWDAGVRSYDEEDWDAAIQHFTKVITLTPGGAAAYENRAFAMLSRDHYGPREWLKKNSPANQASFQAPLADLNQAIALDPTSADAYVGRAICEKALGNWGAAVADADKSAELDPQNATFAADMRGTRVWRWVLYGFWAVAAVILTVGGWSMVKQVILISKAEGTAR